MAVQFSKSAFHTTEITLTPDDIDTLQRGEEVRVKWGAVIRLARSPYMMGRECGERLSND